MRSLNLAAAATLALAASLGWSGANAATFSSFGGSSSAPALTPAPIGGAETIADVRVDTVAIPVYNPPSRDLDVAKMSGVSAGQVFTGSNDWSFLASSPIAHPGAKISTPAGSTCSVGYVVNYNSAQHLVIAGHCGSVGMEFGVRDIHGAWHKVGEVVQSLNGNVEDEALVRVTDSSRVSPHLPMNLPVGDQWSSSQASEADAICKIGYASGLSCGVFQYIAPSGRLVFEGKAAPGDSGATVFALKDGVAHPLATLEGGYSDSLNLAAIPLEHTAARFGDFQVLY